MIRKHIVMGVSILVLVAMPLSQAYAATPEDCEQYKGMGKAYGICIAGIHGNKCGEADQAASPAACARLEQQFLEATGENPPWKNECPVECTTTWDLIIPIFYNNIQQIGYIYGGEIWYANGNFMDTYLGFDNTLFPNILINRWTIGVGSNSNEYGCYNSGYPQAPELGLINRAIYWWGPVDSSAADAKRDSCIEYLKDKTLNLFGVDWNYAIEE